MSKGWLSKKSPRPLGRDGNVYLVLKEQERGKCSREGRSGRSEDRSRASGRARVWEGQWGDLEGQGRQVELRALSAWLAFELEHLPTCCPCSASPNPSSTTQTPCLRAFRSSGSGALRGQAIPESRILPPSLPVFLPFILYQIQLIFPELLLSVKNQREKFLLTLLEALER